jgi:hypothetical protein
LTLKIPTRRDFQNKQKIDSYLTTKLADNYYDPARCAAAPFFASIRNAGSLKLQRCPKTRRISYQCLNLKLAEIRYRDVVNVYRHKGPPEDQQ